MDLSNEMLSAVNSSSRGIVITDNSKPNGPIIFANPAFTILTGYSAAEIIGRNCRFLQGTETDQNVVQEIKDAIENTSIFEGEILNYRKDGSKFWNRLTINPVIDPFKNTTHFVGVQEDVTKQVMQEAEKNQLIFRLEEFSALVAHDLEAPIRHIRQFLELYLKESDQAKPSNEAIYLLDTIKSAVGNASNIIESTLQFSKSNQFGLGTEHVDLNSLVSEIIRTFELDFKSAGAEIEVGNLPTVIGQRTQIYQVFQNLIGNALKYRESSRPCQISIYSLDVNNKSKVIVKDNGIGIPDNELHTVFSAYRRASNSKQQEGSGIGLATVKRIMQSYGGTVSVESKQFEESIFTLTFPHLADHSYTELAVS